jgi:hypothetical protein
MTAANKPDTKKTEPSEWISRTTAILAVIAAISSGRWGASNLQAILEQGKVNDTWSYYQAKSMKQHDAEQTRDLAKALAPGQPAASALSLNDLQKRMEEMARREEIEKNQQQQAAEQFQRSRDRMVESSFWFELSFAALQLGVILCTIATGGNRKTPWVIGVAVGFIGLLLMLNGFHRVVPAPRSWYEGISEQMAYEGKPPTTAPANQ